MSKISLNNVASGYNRSKINQNFVDLQAELQNKVLYRDNPTGEPNQMENDIDMNSNDIANVNKTTTTHLILNGKTVSSGVLDDLDNSSITTATATQTLPAALDDRWISKYTTDELSTATSLKAGDKVRTPGYYAGTTVGGNSGIVEERDGTPEQQGVIIFIDGTTLQVRMLFPGGVVTVEQLGADGTGVLDSYTALQTVLDKGWRATFENGDRVYRTTESLIYKRGGGFYSNFVENQFANEQSDGSSFKGVEIIYDGLSTTGAVIRASRLAVGVDFSDSFNDTLQAPELSGVVVNANELADYGVYAYRVANGYFDNVLVTKSREHGFYGTALYSGRYSNILGTGNLGSGITFGKGQKDFGFSIAQLNAVDIYSLVASGNGKDKKFDLDTNPDHGYGIGMWCHRGNFIRGLLSENNDGANYYIAPTSSANNIFQCYSELGNSLIVDGTNAITDGRAPHKIAMIFDTYGVSSYGNRVSQFSVAGEYIHISGVKPSERYAEINKFIQVSGASGLVSSNDFYSLIDCTRGMTDNISGSLPSDFIGSNNEKPISAATPFAMAVFRDVAGTIEILKSYNVSSVTKPGTGEYYVNFSTDANDDDYGVTTSAEPNRVIGPKTKQVGRVLVEQRGTGGGLSDVTLPATIMIWQ